MVVAAPAGAARIKDIAILRGARDSQLVGYGLVIGLAGTGDTFRNTPFTQQSVQGMLLNLGLDVHGVPLRNRDVASVIVTADLEAGVHAGSRLDVTVSALGDSPSLLGGTLLLTQLQGSDGAVYASAQGAVSVTGFETQGQAQTLSQGVPTAGRIPNGAIVQQEIRRAAATASRHARTQKIRITPRRSESPTRSTLLRSCAFARGLPPRSIPARSHCKSRAMFPSRASWPRSGSFRCEPDMAARVVLDSRTGTVVVGADVQISPVAVTYGTLTVRVNETPIASQPNPFGNGQTVVTPNTQISAMQTGGPMSIIGGSSLRALVNGLNHLGVKPPGIIAILQAIKTAGALQADMVIQ